MLNLKKLLTSTVAISVLLSTFNQFFVSADETNPKNNEQQQLSDVTKGERLSASQQKEIDKDFVESGWQKKKTVDGSTIYTMDDATMIAKMKENATVEQRKQIEKIEKEQSSESFRAKKGVNSFKISKNGNFTLKMNKTVTLMVAGGGGSVAGSLVALIPGVGWSIAGALASTLVGIFAGETIKGGVEVKGLIRNTQPKVLVYSWKYQ